MAAAEPSSSAGAGISSSRPGGTSSIYSVIGHGSGYEAMHVPSGGDGDIARSPPLQVLTPTSSAQAATSPGPTSAVTMTTTQQNSAAASPPGPASNAPTPGRSGSGAAGAAAAGSSRRVHTKSRTGCRTCKTRKIKCDEQKPGCRNCAKHGVDCDFLQAARSAEENERGRRAAAAAASALATVSTLPPGSHALDMTDLELMHNFTTFTYTTLSSDALLRNLWRVTVVQLALECDYVMRCVLAMSALHLAYHRPDRRDRYVARALQYHQSASRSAMALMGDVTDENAENLYLFSVLTIYVTLASPKPDSNVLMGVSDTQFPDWMFLLRGVRHLLHCLQSQNYSGKLLPLLSHGRERYLAMHQERPLLPVSPYSATPLGSGSGSGSDARRGEAAGKQSPNLLAEISARVHRTERIARDPVLLATYDNAIDELRRALTLYLSPGYQDVEVSDAFVWRFLVAEDFLPLIRRQEQEAVAVFAHFGILLKRLESQWWLQGWGVHLVSRAWQVLDPEHRLWIQWPVEEVGWVPPNR